MLGELKRLGDAQILGQEDALSMIESHQSVSPQAISSGLSCAWTPDQGNKPALLQNAVLALVLVAGTSSSALLCMQGMY